MRLPLLKPYRMFPEFDGMSDGECERYVRDAYINAPTLTAKVPGIVTAFTGVLWFVGVPIAAATLPLLRWVPLPTSADGQIVVYLAGGVMCVALVYLLSRDVGVYLGIKRELRRACCRKCGQSLMGVPIVTHGVDPDPAKSTVRCPECGRKYVLLDIGLTPRDLIPFEQRGVDPRVGAKRPRPGA